MAEKPHTLQLSFFTKHKKTKSGGIFNFSETINLLVETKKKKKAISYLLNFQKGERERERGKEDRGEMGAKKARAVVVGGSIAGVSCAHALILAGWDVVMVEKSCAPPSGSPTGAGLGLDPQACQLIDSWLPHPDPVPGLLLRTTFPLTIDQVLYTIYLYMIWHIWTQPEQSPIY